jgi:hypothetical protein
MGSTGINEYRQARIDAIRCLPGRNPGDYFHDGTEVLWIVLTWHMKVKNHPKNVKGILSDVIPLVEHMLLVSEDRGESPYYCKKAHTMIKNLQERFLENTRSEVMDRSGGMNSPTSQPTSPRRPRLSSLSASFDRHPTGRPTTAEPVQFPLVRRTHARHKSITETDNPPYMSYEEAMSWYSRQKASRSTVELRDISALNILADRDMVRIFPHVQSGQC